jgi:hypothetical protein
MVSTRSLPLLQFPRASVRSPRPLGMVRQSRRLSRSPCRPHACRDGSGTGTDLTFDSHDYFRRKED